MNGAGYETARPPYQCREAGPLGAIATSLVAGVGVGRRGRRPDRREGLQDRVRVFGPLGHDPGVAFLQEHRLSLDVQLGAAGNDEADRLVIPPRRPLLLARRFVLPKP